MQGNRLSQFGIVLWAVTIVTAFGFLAAYEQAPGASRNSASSLPADLGLPEKPGAPALLMFLHPKCACSQASAGELEKILSHAPASVQVCLFFYKPGGKPDEWIRTGLYDTARRNGWTVRVDEDGGIARRLGAETSGHVLIFDDAGDLRFSGGVTASRGHWGDNDSARAASDALLETAKNTTTRPVFGCEIQGETPARAIRPDTSSR